MYKKRRMYRCVIACLIFSQANIFGQKVITTQQRTELPNIGIRSDKGLSLDLYGLVKNELFWDTRQLVATRDGDSLSFPAPIVPDVNCNDINAVGTINMLAIDTLMGMYFYGLKFGKRAQASATIEMDFRGVSDCTLNTVRLYNGFFDITFPDESFESYFLLGQYYIPSFDLECFPDTVGYNSGSPFEVFATVPQLQYIQKFPHAFEFIISAAGEINDYSSFGPFAPGYVVPCGSAPATGANFESDVFLRNSKIPVMHVIVRKKFQEKHLAATGFNVRTLKPRLSGLDAQGNLHKVYEHITSVSWFALVKYVHDSIELKAKVIYAQNGAGDGVLGGYGVKCINPNTAQQEYTNINFVNAWVDLHGGKDVQPGVFVGFAYNLGASGSLVDISKFTSIPSYDSIIYGFGTNIAWEWRVAPRIFWTMKTLTVGGEIEYTCAAFGDQNQSGKPKNAKPVGNFRFMVSGYYYY